VNALSGEEWRHGTHECVRHKRVSRRGFLATSATTAAGFAPSDKMNVKAGKQPSADFSYGGIITQIALLGDIAIRKKGRLYKAFESFSRPGWALPV